MTYPPKFTRAELSVFSVGPTHETLALPLLLAGTRGAAVTLVAAAPGVCSAELLRGLVLGADAALAATTAGADWLLVGQVVATNPAAPVRGQKYTVKKGKTPVLAQ